MLSDRTPVFAMLAYCFNELIMFFIGPFGVLIALGSRWPFLSCFLIFSPTTDTFRFGLGRFVGLLTLIDSKAHVTSVDLRIRFLFGHFLLHILGYLLCHLLDGLDFAGLG